MRGYNTSAFARKLAKQGYARHVIRDEIQAYIVAPAGELGAVSNALKPLRQTLRALFRQHGRKLKLPGVR